MTRDTSAKIQSAPYADGPRLLADIGGTNARFALETGPHGLKEVEVLAGKDYRSLQDAIAAFLAGPAGTGSQPIRHAALAIANPVDGDEISMTNHHWSFSINALRAELGLETLLVVNDFTALAMAIPHVSPEQKRKIGGGDGQAGHMIGVIGAGTGLGVSGLIPAGERWMPLSSEGGHVSFSPVNEFEVDILRFAWREHDHVSAERLISGMGLEIIYRALMARAGKIPAEALNAAEISHRALAGTCEISAQTIECFCAMLGSVTGNVALTLGATGGMYIGGGIVPRLGRLFTESSFRARFESKGRFAKYLSQIPTYVITDEYQAFFGVSAILAEKLGDR